MLNIEFISILKETGFHNLLIRRQLPCRMSMRIISSHTLTSFLSSAKSYVKFFQDVGCTCWSSPTQVLSVWYQFQEIHAKWFLKFTATTHACMFTLCPLVSGWNLLKKLNDFLFIQCQKVGEVMKRVECRVAIQTVQVLQKHLLWDSNTAGENSVNQNGGGKWVQPI